MANLYSNNRKDKITVEPLYIDKESWITSKVKLYQNFKITASGVESYFDADEIENLISDAEKLLKKEINHVETRFLEPNLILKIDLLEDDKFMVGFIFKLFWEKVETDKSVKKNQYETDDLNIATFLSEIKSELQTLRKK